MIWGISTNELLCSVALIGMLVAVAIPNLVQVLSRVAQVEAFSLVGRNKLYWADVWANDGIRDVSESPAFALAEKGSYMDSAPNNRADGGMDMVFKSRFHRLEGGVLTIRPAISTSGSGAVIWVCGRAPAPRGFTARGQQSTNILDSELIHTCRGRP